MTGKTDKPSTGRVLEIQRMSTEDGPGIRTTVFFKGCTLRCAWCHNPESISARLQVQWIGSRCIGCLTCVETCPESALSAEPDGIRIDRGNCRGCGACAEACPSTALELLGREWTVASLVREVAKDRAYFERSGGGVTASGGEALVQAPFVAEFLKACREQGLHTALDTCGHVSRQALDAVLPHADLVLFDLKVMDTDRHRELTGADNETILKNLRYVRERLMGPGRPEKLWVRTPIIPGATDNEDAVRAVGRFIAKNLGRLPERWELCAFNNLCRDKYTRLGLDWAFKDADLMTRDDMERFAEAARASGVDPDLVRWSGSTRVESGNGSEPAKLTLVNRCATC